MVDSVLDKDAEGNMTTTYKRAKVLLKSEIKIRINLNPSQDPQNASDTSNDISIDNAMTAHGTNQSTTA